MTRVGAFLCWIAVMGLLTACPMRLGGRAGVAREIQRGDKAQRHHDLASGLSHYERAEAEAARQGARELEAEAALKRVRVIEKLSTRSRLEKGVLPGLETPERRREQIRRAYDIAVAVGTPPQQALARNNLAVMLLEEGHAEDARDVLQRIPDVVRAEAPSLPRNDLSVYVLNYGRALERTGDWNGAYDQFARVVRLRPRFRPGVKSAFRLLRVLQPPRVDEAVRLLDAVLAGGRTRLAERLARESLAAWSADPHAPALLAILVRCMVRSPQSCRDFTDDQWAGLAQLTGGAGVLRAGVVEIESACRRDLGPILAGVRPAQLFPVWTSAGWSAETLSRLLSAVADAYLHSYHRDPRQALARYLATWQLDPANTEAALYAAAIIDAHAEALDPQGRLARTLLPPQAAPAGEDDLQNVIQTRILLGGAFAREGRLGPARELDTAIHQWQWVLDVERARRASDPDFHASPETYLLLGGAYERIGRADLARQPYTEAVQVFERRQDPEGIARTKARLGALGSPARDPGERSVPLPSSDCAARRPRAMPAA